MTSQSVQTSPDYANLARHLFDVFIFQKQFAMSHVSPIYLRYRARHGGVWQLSIVRIGGSKKEIFFFTPALNPTQRDVLLEELTPAQLLTNVLQCVRLSMESSPPLAATCQLIAKMCKPIPTTSHNLRVDTEKQIQILTERAPLNDVEFGACPIALVFEIRKSESLVGEGEVELTSLCIRDVIEARLVIQAWHRAKETT